MVHSRNGKAVRLTMDHKPTEESETKRIKESGYMILNGRVGGILGVSRALGDLTAKNYGLICDPSITRTEILLPSATPSTTTGSVVDTNLVIACDGVPTCLASLMINNILIIIVIMLSCSVIDTAPFVHLLLLLLITSYGMYVPIKRRWTSLNQRVLCRFKRCARS